MMGQDKAWIHDAKLIQRIFAGYRKDLTLLFHAAVLASIEFGCGSSRGTCFVAIGILMDSNHAVYGELLS